MTSPVDTTVKFVYTAVPGSPTAPSGTLGTLIPILDAFLVNGWGSTTPTAAVLSGGFCTMQVSTVNVVAGMVITISGATGSYTGLNGQQKVTGVVGSYISFATALTGTITGTLTYICSPAGYTKLYSGTNQAVYQSNDATTTQSVLFVDDTAAQWARVWGADSASSISAFTNMFPTTAQFSGGLYWYRSNAATSTTNPYFLISNGKKLFYGCAAYRVTTANTPYFLHGYGDITSYKTSDPGRAFCHGANSTALTSGFAACMQNGNVGIGYSSKLHTGLGGSVGLAQFVYGANYSGITGNSLGPMPSPIDSSLQLVQPAVFNTPIASYGYRGYLSGFYMSPQVFASTNAFNEWDLVTGSGDTAGKTLLAVWTGASYSDSTFQGFSFFDITGPWAA